MQYGGRISVGFRQNGDEQIRLQRDGLRSDVRPLAITLMLLSQCVFRGANFVGGGAEFMGASASPGARTIFRI